MNKVIHQFTEKKKERNNLRLYHQSIPLNKLFNQAFSNQQYLIKRR